MSQEFKRSSEWRTNSPAYLFLWLIQQFQLATRTTSPDMTTVFHAWLDDRFIQIQRNLRRKKLHRMNQGPNFLGGSFSNRDNVIASIQFRKESQLQHLENDFSSRTDPSILALIALVLLDRSSKTSWTFPALKSTSHFLPLAPVHSVSQIRFKFRSQFWLLPQTRCLITFRVEGSIISIDSNIADNIIRKVIKGCICYIFARLFLGLNESTCQIKKNAFYFTSKPLFVLEKIKF